MKIPLYKVIYQRVLSTILVQFDLWSRSVRPRTTKVLWTELYSELNPDGDLENLIYRISLNKVRRH